jgi:hypothetical protein
MSTTSKVNLMVGKIKDFVGGYVQTDDMAEDVYKLTLIDKSHLDEEITHGGARFVYIAAIAEYAKFEESVAKQEYEKAKALVSQAIRQGSYEASAGIKVTDKAIEELIEIDDLVSSLKTAYNLKRHEALVMSKLVDAVSLKSELLRTYASNQRRELETLFNNSKTSINPNVKSPLLKGGSGSE